MSCDFTGGFDSVDAPEEDEEDLLDRAWGLEAESRLSCQVSVGKEDLEIEIPKYTINHAKRIKYEELLYICLLIVFAELAMRKNYLLRNRKVKKEATLAVSEGNLQKALESYATLLMNILRT